MPLDDRSRGLREPNAAAPGAHLQRSKRPVDTGRCTWCAGCLTVYDDYRIAVNPIPEFAKVH